MLDMFNPDEVEDAGKSLCAEPQAGQDDEFAVGWFRRIIRLDKELEGAMGVETDTGYGEEWLAAREVICSKFCFCAASHFPFLGLM